MALLKSERQNKSSGRWHYPSDVTKRTRYEGNRQYHCKFGVIQGYVVSQSLTNTILEKGNRDW